jgi:hypothetical protein
MILIVKNGILAASGSLGLRHRRRRLSRQAKVCCIGRVCLSRARNCNACVSNALCFGEMVLQDHPFRNRPLALLIEHTMSLDLLVSDIHPTITIGVAVSIEPQQFVSESLVTAPIRCFNVNPISQGYATPAGFAMTLYGWVARCRFQYLFFERPPVGHGQQLLDLLPGQLNF